MRWTSSFRVGHIDWSIHCNDCNRELIVKGPSIMTKWFHPDPKFCVFCGSSEVIVENIEYSIQH